MAEPGSARQAAERNAQAVMAGNLSQIMADITPEALSQLMAMGAAAGGMSPATMPNIQGYEIEEMGADGDGELFHVTFRSAMGTATAGMTWKQVMGQWKITGVSLVGVNPVEGGAA